MGDLDAKKLIFIIKSYIDNFEKYKIKLILSCRYSFDIGRFYQKQNKGENVDSNRKKGNLWVGRS